MTSWNYKTRSIQPIGLDIGHNSVKMIQLAVSGGKFSVLAADKIRINTGAEDDPKVIRHDVVSAIQQMLARGNFHGRAVVSCLPSDEVKITSLRIDETEFDEIEE